MSTNADRFPAALARIEGLEAVLITADGKPDRQPQGIITVHDLGNVHRLLTD